MEPFPPLCTAIKAILPLMAVQLLAERWAALCSPVCHSSDAILALAPSIRRRYVAMWYNILRQAKVPAQAAKSEVKCRKQEEALFLKENKAKQRGRMKRLP